MNKAKALLDLQAIDRQLARKRSTYRKIAAELEREGDLKELRDQCEAARHAVMERRLEHKKMGSQVAELRERLQGIESRLYSGAITSMRELTALEEEHKNTKRNLAQAEEALGPARTASEQAQQRHEQLKGDFAQAEQSWKDMVSGLRERAHEVEKECEQLRSVRQGAASGISKTDLDLYSSLLPRKGGVAVARVERGVCQGCRIKLPMREIAKLKNADQLVVCGSCGRILLGA